MHGIKLTEAATSVVAVKQVDSAVPFVVGTAPIYRGTAKTPGVPVIAYSFEEAVEKLGYSDDWKTFTLCEAMYVLFKVFAVKPVVFVNVFDTAKHTETVQDGEIEKISDKVYRITDKNVLIDTVSPTVPGICTMEYDEDGYVILTQTGAVNLTSEHFSYKKVSASAVTAADVESGVGAVDHVYHACGVIPSVLLAPGFTSDALTASLAAKARLYDGMFSAVAAVDIGAKEENYSDVASSAKDQADTYVVQCWPCAPMDGRIVHRSVIYAGMCAITDAEYGGIPYASPSNRALPIDGLCTEEGAEISLSMDQANAVENAGVYTGVRLDTWKAWGTYTSAVNASVDPKDIFIATRRMLNWHKNTFMVNYFSKVDHPANRRLIETLIDSENKRIDALKSIGAVAGGRMSFLASENSDADIMAGRLRFRQALGFWPPAREIETVIEIDADLVKDALGGE